MSNPETILLQQIRLALGEIPGVIMYRNPIGHDSRAHVDYGIQNPGGSDLLGWISEIHYDHDGDEYEVARVLAIEVKTATGIVSDAQKRFLHIVRSNGGFAGIARSVEDAIAITRGHQID